jgi:hypothetical protein
VRRIPKGIFHANDPAPLFLALFQPQPLMGITAGSSIRREDDDRLKVAQAGLVPQTVEGRTVSTTPTDAMVKKDVRRQHRVVVRGHVRVERLPLTLDGLRFLWLARRDAGIQRSLPGWPPSGLR